MLTSPPSPSSRLHAPALARVHDSLPKVRAPCMLDSSQLLGGGASPPDAAPVLQLPCMPHALQQACTADGQSPAGLSPCSLIQPLFNKSEPLAEGPLRTKIEDLAASLSFPLKKLFTIVSVSL